MNFLTKYKLTAYSFRDKIIVTYKQGHLQTLELPDHFEPVSWHCICKMVPLQEKDIEGAMSRYQGSLKFEPIKVTPADQKIAMWCEAYKAMYQESYKVTKAEAGMISGVEINADMLQAFFLNDFWTKTKNISNYIKHYNEIKLIAKGKASPGSKDQKAGNGGVSALGATLRKRYS